MSDLKHEARELTQGAGDVVTADRAEDRVAELDATIFRWWARRREASIEAGRAFNELKKILGHGKWQAHFAGTFAKCGISLRTAERCMKLARKADARAKIDKLSILKPANDRSAQEIKEAAQRDMAAASGRKKQTGRYSLPLHMCT